MNISAAWQLEPRQLAVLKALASWRELRARQRDKPKNWIVRDKELLNIAKELPSDSEALTAVDGLHASFIRYEGAAVLDLVQQALNISDTDLPPRIERPLSNAQKKHFKKAQELVAAKAEALGLPVEILGRKRTLMELFLTVTKQDGAAGQQGIPIDEVQLPVELQGWRHDILVQDLLELMQ